jgi:hypothetical protein
MTLPVSDSACLPPFARGRFVSIAESRCRAAVMLVMDCLCSGRCQEFEWDTESLLKLLAIPSGGSARVSREGFNPFGWPMRASMDRTSVNLRRQGFVLYRQSVRGAPRPFRMPDAPSSQTREPAHFSAVCCHLAMGGVSSRVRRSSPSSVPAVQILRASNSTAAMFCLIRLLAQSYAASNRPPTR